jgi:membrane-associated phospholipid phosphatase
MSRTWTLTGTVSALALSAGLVSPAPAIAANPSALPALSPVSSAEMQKLMHTRSGAVAVNCNLIGLPGGTPTDTYARLFMWNAIALDTIALDETPPNPGCTYTFGQQFGPTRSSRSLAIFSIAEFEAVNALTSQYKSYVGLPPFVASASIDVAIAQAGHDALVYLFPSQQSRLDALLNIDLTFIKGSPTALANGKLLGQQAAAAIIALRTNDGSQIPEPTVGNGCTLHTGPGYYQVDPVSQNTTCLGYYWGQVKPFVVQSASQFLPPPPPALTSPEWVQNFALTKTLGGDPSHGTPTTRTQAETVQGIYWTYDGVPELCAPPRLYDQILVTESAQHPNKINTVPKAAQFFAVANSALADAGISAWYTKWYYQFWRPVTAIRAADQGNNGLTKAAPNWTPLGGQATDELHVRNFTPPFPAYVSGHATFGGAIFQTLRNYFGENAGFTFISDEYNGLNYNDKGMLQPFLPQTFPNITAAEYQNAESRIYIGVHWQFDADAGVHLGNQIANYVIANAFQPVASN